MMHRLNLLLLLCLFCAFAGAQTNPPTSCGQQAVMQQFYATHPEYKTINDQVEKLLAQRNRDIQSGVLKNQRTTAIVTLPVVVHIIHNNGPENIPDAQVFQGIQHLNEAFANTGYYDPADGVNTQIQFCMAQRDPSNNASNGITRDVSPYTVMGGSNYYSDDQNVKNINRWNPLCYVNIWLVQSIPGSVVGYAYFPSAHGSSVDGIIIEAGYFGNSFSNDVVVAHEMGHYLGLYHTFEGGCTNNDCTSDGDKVCDTPPDQSTAGISCTSSANSCTTDALSGFAADQNDLTQDYMDYGNFNCMKVFTQGQADRMNWFIQNVRKSLLACKSCMNPCPAPVTAGFTMPATPFIAGTAYTFTNTSVNAAGYEWWVNGVLQATVANFTYTFPAVGSYTIKLVAKSTGPLCDDDIKTINLNAICGVTAGFTKSVNTAAAGTNINFTNTSSGANTFQWLVNGTLQSSTTNFTYTSSTAGDYIITLMAGNSSVNCQQVFTDTVHYTCSVVADFTPSSTGALINTPVTFNSTGTGATVYQWLVNGLLAGTGTSLTYTFTVAGAYSIQLVAGNGLCSAAKNGLVYVTDKCGNAQYLFQKTYTAGLNSSAQDMRTTPDGGAVLAEKIFTSVVVSNAAILKLDAAGNKQWLNAYGNGSNSFFRKIKTTADGGYIAIGNIQSPGTQGSVQTFIVKTTAIGGIVWTRAIGIQNAFSNQGNDILQAADGSYYFTGTIEQPGINGSTDIMAGKLDATGNLLWFIGYDARSSEAGNGITDDNSHVTICGNKGGQTSNSGFLLQLNKSDGSVVWASTYQSADENFLDVQTLVGGYFINAIRRNNAAGPYTDHVYLKTDATGKLSYSTFIQPFGTVTGTDRASALVKPNGNIVSQTTSSFGAATYNDFIIQEINPAAGGLWAKKYNKPDSWMNTLNVSAANEIWSAGNSIETAVSTLQTFVIKADSLGNTGNCPATAVTVELLHADYITGIADFTGKPLQAQISSNHTATPVDAISSSICQFVKCDSVPAPVDTCKLCDNIHLSGPDTLCSFINPIAYSANRNAGCPAVPSWQLTDSTMGTISVLNDTSISVLFKKTGYAKLVAAINTGCKLITDTVAIHIFTSSGNINLGPDIQLCKFSSIKLNAGTGFVSYLWNDGSVDSILTAYNPGQYFVKATDYCGNTYRDTINITTAPDIPFDLGPDLQKCNTDTITISAPGNFAAYSWAVNYNINTINGAAVKVWPAKDTTYTVVAQVANGCTVIDTIRIKVNQSPPLHLGNDTSFCAGGSVLLKAPAGFSNYTWQDGSSGNTFSAAQQGLYWLKATADNGCISEDSLVIDNVYPLPLNFLDSTATVCNGKNLELKAMGSWPAYLWFNNSSSSSVTVTAPGKYWLQVTSADGCSARDSIVVTAGAHCGFGIHFPNAFTPDNNGNNDTYKPVVFSVPEQFRLLIFNRFGEKVFETGDYKQGWAGIYKGRRQPPDTFVWYCTYQFAGSPVQMEKGTLVLIR